MTNWIAVHTNSGKKHLINLDKVACVKWESGILCFYNKIDGSHSAEKPIAYADQDGLIYSSLMDLIAKGAD